MTRSKLLSVVFIGTFLFMLTGCGGGSSTLRSPSGLNSSGNGRATVSVKWPTPSRLIPLAANSIKVSLTNGTNAIASTLLTRPTGQGALVSSYTFTNLPIGTFTATSTAYPNTDGSGVAQAVAADPLTIVNGQSTPLTLTMASTITTVLLTPPANSAPVAPSGTLQLTATPEDVSGNTVLVAPSNLSWTSSDATQATINQSGLLTRVGSGAVTISVTDTEVGITGTYSLDTPLLYVVDSGNNRIEELNASGALSYTSMFGTPGSGNGNLNQPTDIAINSTGDLFVLDSGNSRVEVFNSAGTYLTQFGTFGVGNGQFSGANSIALGPNNEIFVSDISLNRVEVLQWNGSSLSFLTGTDLQGVTLNVPFGITYSNGNLFVAEGGSGDIQVLKWDGSSFAVNTIFGTFGSGNGQFAAPFDICMDGVGDTLFVADTGNSRVEALHWNGTALSYISSTSSSSGLSSPQGVRMVGSTLYVTDASTNTVTSFLWNGTTFTNGSSFGATGSGNAMFNTPMGLAYTP